MPILVTSEIQHMCWDEKTLQVEERWESIAREGNGPGRREFYPPHAYIT